jgi:uncharacterized membrane protein
VLGGSGFIGAFAGGVIFGLASEARSPGDNALTEHLGAVFDALSFLLVGAMLLPLALDNASWSVVGYAVLSLVLLRLASVTVAVVGTKARPQTVGFMGWFGPRGLATVVFTVMLIEAVAYLTRVFAPIAVFGIVLSVFATAFRRPARVAYATWWNGVAGDASSPEAQRVHEHRVRLVRALDQPARSGPGRGIFYADEALKFNRIGGGTVAKPDGVIIYAGSYNDLEDAKADLEGIRVLHNEKFIGEFEAAVFQKLPGGKVKVIDTVTTMRSFGAKAGAVTGALVGIFFPPALLAEVAIGAGAGAVMGNLFSGLKRGDIKEIGEMLDERSRLILTAFTTLEVRTDRLMKKAAKILKKEVDATAEDLKKSIDEAVDA